MLKIRVKMVLTDLMHSTNVFFVTKASLPSRRTLDRAPGVR